MNDLDEVLAKLRSAEAPEGMEGRIIARLKERRAGRRTFAAGWWLGGLAAVAALLLAVAVKEVRKPAVRVDVASDPRPQVSSPLGGSVGLQPHEQSPLKERGFSRGPIASTAVGLSRSKQSRNRPVSMATVESFPAPPEPLTAQEKLLIRVAQSGDREDFNLLNLETFELAMAADKADFDAFLRAEGAKPRP